MLRTSHLAFVAAALTTFAAISSLAGCGEDDATPAQPLKDSGRGNDTGAGTDGGGGTDGGTDSSVADTSVEDAGLNGCKTFMDLSAASATRTIPWDFPVAMAPERCMTVKKGQDVTWAGNFLTHPLGVKGGDSPNPIAGVDAQGKVTFANAGLFGYECTEHPTIMNGAIMVIE